MQSINFSKRQLPGVIAGQLFFDGLKPKLFLVKGPLGAGKTTFAQAIGHFLGLKTAVNSPTFNYVNIYQLPSHFSANDGLLTQFLHFDLYRLSSGEEFVQLGLLDLLYRPEAIFFVEWPEILYNLVDFSTFEIPVLELRLGYASGKAKQRQLIIERLN